MNENRIIRLHELKVLVGLSTATIWRKEKDSTFPKRRKISKRAVGWMYAEISRWMNEQATTTEKSGNVK